MDIKEAIQDLQFLARRYEELDQVCYSVKRESLDVAIITMQKYEELQGLINEVVG